MSWEIKIKTFGGYDPKEAEALNAIAAEGWEPYAVSGEKHYFKRASQKAAQPDPNIGATATGKTKKTEKGK